MPEPNAAGGAPPAALTGVPQRGGAAEGDAGSVSGEVGGSSELRYERSQGDRVWVVRPVSGGGVGAEEDAQRRVAELDGVVLGDGVAAVVVHADVTLDQLQGVWPDLVRGMSGAGDIVLLFAALTDSPIAAAPAAARVVAASGPGRAVVVPSRHPVRLGSRLSVWAYGDPGVWWRVSPDGSAVASGFLFPMPLVQPPLRLPNAPHGWRVERIPAGVLLMAPGVDVPLGSAQPHLVWPLDRALAEPVEDGVYTVVVAGGINRPAGLHSWLREMGTWVRQQRGRERERERERERGRLRVRGRFLPAADPIAGSGFASYDLGQLDALLGGPFRVAVGDVRGRPSSFGVQGFGDEGQRTFFSVRERA